MIQQFIEHFTYAGLFLTLFAAGLGLPIPEEVAIIAGGVLAHEHVVHWWIALPVCILGVLGGDVARSEEHTSELQSRRDLVCRLLLEKKKLNTFLIILL